MKRILLLSFIAMAFLPLRAQVSFGGLMFSARLDTVEQPGGLLVASSGNGIAGFSYHNDTLWFDITANGLTGPITAAHIHAESDHGVVYSLVNFINGNKIKGYLTGINLNNGSLKSFLDGEYYVNIHTAANPGGEISGHIVPETDVNYKAVLDMEQAGHANPGGMVPMGLGSVNLSLDKTKLEINILVNDLTSNITNAHLHYGAPGVSGPVIIPISQFKQGNSYYGVYDLTALSDPAAFLDSLEQGKVYINVHTSNYPAGEIRGQLMKNRTLSFDTWMNSAQETGTINAATPPGAKGLCNFSVNSQGDSLWVNIQSDSLSGAITGAHFHSGKAGVSGGVVVPLTNFISGNMISGVITAEDPIFTGGLSIESFIDLVLSGDIYVNMHTSLNPAGEVRGQPSGIARKGVIYSLCNQQVSSSVTGNGQGSGFVTIDRNHTNLHYGIAIANLGSMLTADHFHDGLPGINGGVIHALPTDSTLMGFWNDATFTPEIADKFINGAVYANFHTSNYPGGEIRGQVAVGDLCLTTTGLNALSKANVYPLSIYPNPVRRFSTISYSLPRNSDVLINLYNVLGEKVSTLSRGNRSAGIYNQTIDASGLQEGVYIYTLMVNGSIVNSGKVIVSR